MLVYVISWYPLTSIFILWNSPKLGRILRNVKLMKIGLHMLRDTSEAECFLLSNKVNE